MGSVEPRSMAVSTTSSDGSSEACSCAQEHQFVNPQSTSWLVNVWPAHALVATGWSQGAELDPMEKEHQGTLGAAEVVLSLIPASCSVLARYTEMCLNECSVS
jgi:hypothetical protein